MPPASTEDLSSKAGIATSETGQRYIPHSIRADGSQRKEIKIRPGYKPPEDVEIYKNRTAESWKTRENGVVPGSATLEPNPGPSGSKFGNKNAKRREARRKAKEITNETKNGASPQPPSDVNQQQKVKIWQTAAEEGIPETNDVKEEAENEKQARKVQKKLRQAKELREKRDNGEALLPEQFAKVIKIHELIRELDHLGFDANGDPKEREMS